jgi:hypothetical protein
MVFGFFEIVPGFFSVGFFTFKNSLFLLVSWVFYRFGSAYVPFCFYFLLKKIKKGIHTFTLYKQKSFVLIMFNIYHLSS